MGVCSERTKKNKEKREEGALLLVLVSGKQILVPGGHHLSASPRAPCICITSPRIPELRAHFLNFLN